MHPLILPALAAGGDLLGGLYANAANRREGRANRQFQERMSSTAFQRARVDMEAAGLNPYAMYGGTHAASSPGGSQARIENPVSGGIHSALAAKEAQARIANVNAQTAKVNEESALLQIERGAKSTTQGDEPTYMQEVIARRVATLRDLAHAGRLQPHDERLRALAVMMERAKLSGVKFRGELFDDAAAVTNFIRKGTSSARGAWDAWKAWDESGRARDRALGSSLRSKFFTSQHPRAKAQRRK